MIAPARRTSGFLLEIAGVFFKMGFMTFGGGFAMLPLIQEEVVEKRHWIEEDKITEVFAVAQSLPGSLSINASILIGYEVARVPGALAAVLGAAVPPFVTITAIAAFFGKFQGNPIIDAAFMGVRCAVVALIWNAGLGSARTSVRSPLSRTILGLTIVLMMFSSLNPAILIVILALLGVGAMLFRTRLDRKSKKPGQERSET